MTQEEINNLQIKKASYFAILVSITLCCLKFYTYTKTASCSLHASAMDSMMDIVISFINLLAVYILALKKSNLAPFGWDKIAVIVSLIQGILTSFIAIEIVHESIEKLYSNHHYIEHSGYILLISFISFVFSLLLIIYQKKVIKQTDSLVIKADMIHFVSDLYSNAFMFIGFVFMKFFDFTWIDAILGIFISLYLIKSIFGLAKTSLISLLDLNLKREQEKVINLLKLHKYEIKSEQVNVLFSGARYIINININNDLLKEAEKIKNIVNNIFLAGPEEKCHSHGCKHVSEALKSTKMLKVNIQLN